VVIVVCVRAVRGYHGREQQRRRCSEEDGWRVEDRRAYTPLYGRWIYGASTDLEFRTHVSTGLHQVGGLVGAGPDA
jgi:hypothetical protein